MKNLKTRVGVISQNEIANQDLLFWELLDYNNMIDLTFEEYVLDLKEEGLSDSEIEEKTENYESDYTTYLVGDGWKKVNGKYEIDKTKELAATYSNNSGIICVEYSKYIKECGPTSPCYVMADGSGPCGDLASVGPFRAYSLPVEYFQPEKMEGLQ